MSKQIYDHNSIKVMEEIEHIQNNAGMYIGETDLATHLVTEALDNSLDEAKAGFANIVAVTIDTNKKEYGIVDNGRGIPIENDTIKTVASKLFSGGKFNKGEHSVYGIASGRHGVGIVAITALSEYNTVEVYRDGKYAIYEWKKSQLINDEHRSAPEDPPFSTSIKLKPDKKYFESIDIDIDYIRRRMKIASVHIPHLQLLLVVDNKKEIINCNLDQFFNEDILNKQTKNISKVHDILIKIKDEELLIRWAYCFDGSPTPKQRGCINLLSVDTGTHINATQDLFRDILFEYAKKEKLHFNKSDCLVGLRTFTSLMLYQPEYSSQSKEKFSSSKSKYQHLLDKAAIQLRKYLNEDQDLRNQLLQFFETYRKRLESSKSIIKSSNGITRLNSVIGSVLKDCTSHNLQDSELYILEGASAEGTLLSCRDPRYHAVLPLKGKIPNVAAMKTTKDILKNEEITEIINACGTGIEPDFEFESLRYGKIIFTVDADFDGYHIATLLMVLFLKIMPKLIEKNKVFLANLPLYGAQLNSTFHPLFTEDDKEKFKKDNPKTQITRFKGLGEMNPDQLQLCLLSSQRKLILVSFPKKKEKIFELMIDSNLKRKLV